MIKSLAAALNPIAEAVADVAVRSPDTLYRAALSASETTRPILHGLHACNLAFCVYAALAAVLLLKLQICRKEHRPEQAQECAVHGLAGALLALAYLLRHG